MNRPIYQYIANKLNAARNCMQRVARLEAERAKSGEFDNVKLLELENAEDWAQDHLNAIRTCVREYFPSGSGFDQGTTFDEIKSDDDRLYFDTSFHHMDSDGVYSKWTTHTVCVKPSLVHGFTLSVSGKNYNDIKDYIGDMFHEVLSNCVDNDGRVARVKGGE